MKKLSFYFCCFMLFTTYNAQGQSYATTLGVRFGNDPVKRTLGLTLQQKMAKNFTLEGIVQTDFTYNTNIHALAKLHHPMLTRRLNFYMGTGFSLGREQSKEKDPLTLQLINTYGHTTFGADILAGIEFTMAGYNISADYKPNFNITGRDPWYLGQVGISVRAVLIKAVEQNRKNRKKQREKRREERKSIIKDFFPFRKEG